MGSFSLGPFSIKNRQETRPQSHCTPTRHPPGAIQKPGPEPRPPDPPPGLIWWVVPRATEEILHLLCLGRYPPHPIASTQLWSNFRWCPTPPSVFISRLLGSPRAVTFSLRSPKEGRFPCGLPNRAPCHLWGTARGWFPLRGTARDGSLFWRPQRDGARCGGRPRRAWKCEGSGTTLPAVFSRYSRRS